MNAPQFLHGSAALLVTNRLHQEIFTKKTKLSLTGINKEEAGRVRLGMRPASG